ncbi:M20 family metallo-hydrolase [Haladaptatus pallidirubidus]|uniref:Zn-dependent hydrolase n=1 Tax=Haladaptatus pallidirubidus TaxID=1008152 RepID=A0AAV3UH12_9EURY|nr:M20 family metallo-hydrolase [Haladaptatus pallidirubidus]
MEINGERLREDIEANAEFGALDVEGNGRTVITGTEANRKAREYFVERLEDAGLDVRVDAVGNIAGRWTPESAPRDAKPVAAGSHLDSVPEGGIFDGPLGVYSALEAVRAMRGSGVEPSRPIEVVSFTEEEGQRFADGLLGSSVAVGERSVEETLALTDGRTTLADALETMGFDGEGRLDASEWDSWLELHVEQGKRLERTDLPVGTVTTITGITHCAVEVLGEANHAGATPMPERTDALVAASEFVRDVEEGANEVGETTVGTVGKLNVRPNATNVVPGTVEMGVDIRDVSYDAMDELVSLARDSLSRLESERGVETSFAREFDLEPTEMSDRCRRAVHDAGDAANIELLEMHSGAAHDTMHVADVTDAAMLFARSRDGISHNPEEWTTWEDCAAATQVLAGALASLAR